MRRMETPLPLTSSRQVPRAPPSGKRVGSRTEAPVLCAAAPPATGSRPRAALAGVRNVVRGRTVFLELKTVGNGREIPQTVLAPIFFTGNGNGNGIGGRKNETDITGYQERNMSVGNMSITIGNR